MANVSFHLGTSTPSTSGLTAGGIYVNSSTGGIWYATSATARVPLGFDAPITTAGTGAAYTATVGHILSLTAGASFVMKPHATATSTSPTLNVNSLGAKTIKRRLSNGTSTTAALYANSNIYINKPVRVTYDGTYWILEDLVKPAAADLYGTVSNSQLASGISGSKISNPWIKITKAAHEIDADAIPDDAQELLVTVATEGGTLKYYSNSTTDRSAYGTDDSFSTGVSTTIVLQRVGNLYSEVTAAGYNKSTWFRDNNTSSGFDDLSYYTFKGTGVLHSCAGATNGMITSVFTLLFNPSTKQYRLAGRNIYYKAGSGTTTMHRFDINDAIRSLGLPNSVSVGIMIHGYRY